MSDVTARGRIHGSYPQGREQQPTKFDFAIKVKVAKELGVNLPPTLLPLANEVIEQRHHFAVYESASGPSRHFAAMR
jgi:hypothetical protein